jgi:hypothetical protein
VQGCPRARWPGSPRRRRSSVLKCHTDYSALATATEAEATWSEEKSTATDSAAIFDPLLGDSTTILPRGVCGCKPAATVVPGSARCVNAEEAAKFF